MWVLLIELDPQTQKVSVPVMMSGRRAVVGCRGVRHRGSRSGRPGHTLRFQVLNNWVSLTGYIGVCGNVGM